MAQLQAKAETAFIVIQRFRDSIKSLIKTSDAGLVLFYCGQCGFQPYHRSQKGPIQEQTKRRVNCSCCAIFTLVKSDKKNKKIKMI